MIPAHYDPLIASAPVTVTPSVGTLVVSKICRTLVHTELDALQDPDACVAYHTTETNEIATVMMDAKVVNTRSTFFTPDTTVTGDNPSPITSPLVTNFKETFNVVDAFNKLFYSCSWQRCQSRWTDNVFDTLIQITAVNAYSICTIIHNCNELIFSVWLEQLIDELFLKYEWWCLRKGRKGGLVTSQIQSQDHLHMRRI